jgi:predicted nucleic acid-binding protein
VTLDVPSRRVLVLDTPPLYHFALADRLDVLRDLLLDWRCWTTSVVLGELRERSAVTGEAKLLDATALQWLTVTPLNDDMAEIRCFLKWVGRIGHDDRHLGEASVFAAAELLSAAAITDDNDARRVAREHGLEVHGTVWLLAAACRAGKMTEAAAGNLIDGLRASGHRLPCTGAEFPAFGRGHGLLG